MTKKAAVDQSGFQLDPKEFHTGNILVDGFITKAVEAVNKLDVNHDNISDVAELAPYVAKVIPKLIALWAYVKTENLVDVIGSSPIFEGNNSTAKTILKDVVAIMNEAQALADKHLQAPAPTSSHE